MVVGDCDTGKSTFCAYLVRRLGAAGLQVGLVDSDVGQSTFGPPMTIGGKVCLTPADIRPNLHPPYLFFTGSATPVGRMVESIDGTMRVAQRVWSAGARWIVVDTTGMIAGEAGRQLKLQKARLLRPTWIVALRRGGELDGVLLRLEREGRNILRAEVAPGITRRSREQRRRRRYGAYAEYFRNAVPIHVESNRVPIYDMHDDAPDGTLVGLNDGHGNTLAVGVVAAFDRERAMLRLNAPPFDTSSVKYVKLAAPGTDRFANDVAG